MQVDLGPNGRISVGTGSSGVRGAGACRLRAAHGQAGLASEGFRNIEVVPQPFGGIDDVRPGRVRPAQIRAQFRRERVDWRRRPYLAIRGALSAQPAIARVAIERAAARSASFREFEPISAPSARVRACLACG